jgi:hypothetical protein
MSKAKLKEQIDKKKEEIAKAERNDEVLARAQELIELLPVSIKSISLAVEHFMRRIRVMYQVNPLPCFEHEPKPSRMSKWKKEIAQLTSQYKGTKEDLELELKQLALKESLSRSICKLATFKLDEELIEKIYKTQKKTWEHRWNNDLWRWEIQDPKLKTWQLSTKDRHQPKQPNISDFITEVLKQGQSKIGLAQTFNLNESDINKLLETAEARLMTLGLTLPDLPRVDLELRKKQALEQALGGDVAPSVLAELQRRMGIVP